MFAMDSDRADRVGHRIAEIVHVDPDRDPGAPFADRSKFVRGGAAGCVDPLGQHSR
jgi:hypothetical protein